MMRGKFSHVSTLLVFISVAFGCAAACAQQSTPPDLSRVVIVASASAKPTERAAIELFQQESNKRTDVLWPVSFSPQPDALAAANAAGNAIIVIARADQIAPLLPASLRAEWLRVTPPQDFLHHAEGFTVHSFSRERVVVVAGNDSRGVLYGVGYLLRKLSFSSHSAMLTGNINTSAAPQYAIRSHQIGYRYKNNTYDAWDLPLFEQHIRDLAVFGASGLQLIAPHSDDRLESPLYPAPALPTLVGISRILEKYGLDCDVYYPELRHDYSSAQQVSDELADFEAFVRAMPHITALYVPGGDPGHTAPHLLFPLLAQEAEILHRYHPGATVWISAQGFDGAWFAEFYSILREQQPAWLTGVFFGPQSRDSFPLERKSVPAKYKMIFYPDIGHTMHAQFPVPQWDPTFAMTEGREPIDPRPRDFTHIFRTFAALHSGFQTYSEGVNDDLNKFIFTRLGWSKDASPEETVDDYCRYFIGPYLGSHSSQDLRRAVFALEENWRYPLLQNTGVERTLKTFQSLESEATPAQRNNWRFESLLYRAYYDEYLRARLQEESSQEKSALDALKSAPAAGSESAIHHAEEILQQPLPQNVLGLRTHVFDLADRLNHHIRIQLSVEKYGASGIERGANLDHIDLPLNNRVWLLHRFAEVRGLPTELLRVEAINTIIHWEQPVPGTLYDDLGDPSSQREVHLYRGVGFAQDPEFYHTAIEGIADKTTEDGWRRSWLSYAETLYEVPLTLNYTHLDPKLRYTLRVTYAGEDYTLPLTLTANGNITIDAAHRRRTNPEFVDYEIPAATTQSGTLRLEWQRPAGLGGSGRGRQVAEVWLIPHAKDAPAIAAAQSAGH